MVKDKKGQTHIHLIVGIILILAGVSFLIKYPTLGYVLGGIGLITEAIKKLIQGGILQ